MTQLQQLVKHSDDILRLVKDAPDIFFVLGHWNTLVKKLKDAQEAIILLQQLLVPPSPGQVQLIIDERISGMSYKAHLVLPPVDTAIATRATSRKIAYNTVAGGSVSAAVALDQSTVDGLVVDVGEVVAGVLTDSNVAGSTSLSFSITIPVPDPTAAPVIAGTVTLVVDGAVEAAPALVDVSVPAPVVAEAAVDAAPPVAADAPAPTA